MEAYAGPISFLLTIVLVALTAFGAWNEGYKAGKKSKGEV